MSYLFAAGGVGILREIREQPPVTIHDMYILAFPRKIVAKREIRTCPLQVFEWRSLTLRYETRRLRSTPRKLWEEWGNNGGQEDYKWLFCASFFASVYSSLMIIVSIFIASFEKRFFIELFTRLYNYNIVTSYDLKVVYSYRYGCMF